MMSKIPIPRENIFSWINPSLELTKSLIDGTGYKTTGFIKKDEKLVVQSGQCLHVSKIDDAAMESCWYFGFQIETDIYYYPFYIDNQPYLDGIFRINHSCEPNAGFQGQITLVAMRDIEPGEEITYDYVMTDVETSHEAAWKPEECHCGKTTCRKTITGSDWKLPELQNKYAGYLSTYVTNLVKAVDRNEC